MNLFRFVATMSGLLMMMLTACVTETTGRAIPVEQPVEAADLNVQLGIGVFASGRLAICTYQTGKSDRAESR